jgi:hypothetical protein
MAPALPISQFYHVRPTAGLPSRLPGSMQDIGTAQGPSNSLRSGGIRNTDWYGVGGGEAGWVVSDTLDPKHQSMPGSMAGSSRITITEPGRFETSASIRKIHPGTARPTSSTASSGRHRSTSHRTTAKVVYHGGNVLFRTTDGGQTWTEISGDLTRNDRSKQQWAGGRSRETTQGSRPTARSSRSPSHRSSGI